MEERTSFEIVDTKRNGKSIPLKRFTTESANGPDPKTRKWIISTVSEMMDLQLGVIRNLIDSATTTNQQQTE